MSSPVTLPSVMSDRPSSRPTFLAVACSFAILASVLGTVGCASTQPASTAPARAGEWNDRLDFALDTARAEQRPVLALFCGSDWNPACQKMEQNVFSEQAFVDYAKDNLVLLRVDFPQSFQLDPSIASENARLKESHGISDLPTVLFLDPDGKELLRTPGGSAAAEEYVRGWREALATPRFAKLADGTMPMHLPTDATWRVENGAVRWIAQGNPSGRLVMSGIRFFDAPARLRLRTFARGASVHYTLDGSDPTPASPRANGEITVSKTVELRARSFAAEQPVSPVARFLVEQLPDVPVPEEHLRK